jgi:cytochrome c556
MVQTEAFWKTKSKTDAMQWAQEAKKHVDTANAAITAAKWDEAKSAAATLGQQCAACHGTYRERMDDGTFRIKLPAPGTR